MSDKKFCKRCGELMPTIRTCDFPLWEAGVCSQFCLTYEKEAQKLRREQYERPKA